MSLRRTLLPVLATLVLTAGLLIGLITGAAAPGRADTTTTTTTASATVPEPVVTTVVQTTVAGQTLPGTNRPPVLLADLDNPEQLIIGQLYQQALEQRGYRVYLISRNPGVPHVRAAAIQQQNLDLYPEYLASWNSSVARLHQRFRTLAQSYAAASHYARRHGFVLLPPTPFSDTSCVAVLAQYARANHIYSLSQLAGVGPVAFGAPLDFQTDADGLPALEQSYHVHPDYVQPIVDGLGYGWLRSGNVQAAYCSTTDPALDGPEYVQLADPKSVFGHGNVVPVTTRSFVEHEGRAFVQTIEKVDSLLTQRAIRGLNSEYELGSHTAAEIAEQFLQGNGMLPPSRYAPVPTTTTTATTATGA